MLPAFSFARPLLPVVGSDSSFPVRRIFCVGRVERGDRLLGRIAGLGELQVTIV